MSWEDFKKQKEQSSSWENFKKKKENKTTVAQSNTLNKTQEKKSLWENIQSIAQDAGRIGSNLYLGAKTGIKHSIDYGYDLAENRRMKLPGEDTQTKQVLGSKELSNTEKAMYLSLKNNDNSLDNDTNESQSSVKEILPLNLETSYDKEKVDKIANTDILDESIMKDNQKIQENIENQNYAVTKKLSELAPSIGNMAVGSVASAVNPGLGLAYFTTSASGSYKEDALNRGMTEDEAEKYGAIMGLMEGATEMIGIENFQKAGLAIKSLIKGGAKETAKKGAKEIAKNSIKDVLKNYGIGIADNVMQESIIEPISEAVAGAVGGQDKADWSNMGSRMLQAGIDGGLTSAILGGANIGIYSCSAVVEKIQNNQRVTQYEIQNAIQDASKKFNVEEMIIDSTKQQVDKINRTNQKNTVDNLQQNSTNNPNIIQNQQITPQENNLAQNGNSEQINNIVNNKELPMQNFQYEKSDNIKVNNLRQDANKYFNNTEKAHNFVNMLEKIIVDKDIDIRLDDNLKTTDGKLINGIYSNGTITINPNSTRAGEFIAMHELTHAIGTKEMQNIISKYRESNTEFDTAVKNLLQNYNETEITEEALADVSAQLFGNQEFINNIAQNNPNIFQKIYSEIKYLWHQFRGYKNQNQFIEDLYYKWTQAYNSSNKLNDTTNYYIEPVADFNEMEYNNSKEIKLPKQEYAILSGIVNSDSNIKPGINYVETTNATYTVYYKDTGEFKILDKEVSEDYYDEPTERIISRTNESGNAKTRLQAHSSTIQERGTGTHNDEISNFNKRRTRISNTSMENDTTNNGNVKYSIQESENNSGSFNLSNKDNKGRTLTQEQQDYFKDSKVRDEKGNLKTVYHGTDTKFTVFNYDYLGKNGTANGKGFYFADDINVAKSYSDGKNIIEAYVDIQKPLSIGKTTITKNDYIKFLEAVNDKTNGVLFADYGDGGKIQKNSNQYKEIINQFKEEYNYSGDDVDLVLSILNSANITLEDGYRLLKNTIGYDGIIVETNYKDNGDTISYTQYIPLTPEQIKNVDNTNPTDNPDIRYSQNNETWQQYLDKNFKSTGTRTNLQDILPTKQETELNLPPVTEQNNSKNIEKTPPITNETKRRKHYESIINSQYISDEAKAITRELIEADEYVPESNAKQLERADERIKRSGADSELDSLLSRAITGGNIKADDIAVGERLIQYYSKTGNKEKLRDSIQATAMAGTSAGQTVQALSLLNHQTPEGQAVWLQRSVDKMNNDLKKKRGQNAEQFNLTDEMLDKIVNSQNSEELENNLNEVYSELGQQVSKTFLQQIDAWRYFSMLANPKTHIRNIGGNTAMSVTQKVKNKVAGAIEGAINKFYPDMERTHTIKKSSEEVRNFAKADIKNVADRLGLSENKYNPKTRLENSMRTFKSDKLENTLGKLFDLNDKTLEAEDGWGLKAGYTNALAEYMTANNLTPENITDKQLSKARNYAIEQAKEATFHQASAIASALNQISNKNGLAKFAMDSILPFKKTPINVAKTGLEYSPVGLSKSLIYDTVELRKGNITVNKYIDNISKGLTGTGIALLGYALADAGILKASGSDDDNKEKYDEQLGNQTYSIKIGENTYSLDWLSPVGIPLFIGVETFEIKQTEKEETVSSSDENSSYNKAIKSATNILDAFTNAMNPMTEMSMLSGLTSALKSYDQGSSQMLADLGTNTVKSYVNQFVPTALGQIARTTDNYERTTTSTKTGVLPRAIDTTKNQIMNKILGLRQTLPIRSDLWGNDVEQSENIVQRALENAIYPWTRKEISSSTVDNALSELYDEIGENSILPSTLNKKITINGTNYRLTNEEYSEYSKDYGKTSYNLLNKLVSSNEYKKLTDTQKQTAIESIYNYAKEKNKIDYAESIGEEIEESTMYTIMKELEVSGGNQSQYLSYLAKTKDIQGQEETKRKNKVLLDSNYSSKTKSIIYENTTGKDDNIYQSLKSLANNSKLINEYLKYKQQTFESDYEDDGTEEGKAISGSKKLKVYDYINNSGFTYNQRLLLLGTQYKLTNAERSKIFSIVDDSKLTKNEKLDMFKTFKGFTVYKNGTVKY